MRKIREVLRLSHEERLSPRQVSRSLGMPRTSVMRFLERSREAGLAWPLPEKMDAHELEGLLFARAAPPPTASRQLPDWREVHRELHRKDMTLWE